MITPCAWFIQYSWTLNLFIRIMRTNVCWDIRGNPLSPVQAWILLDCLQIQYWREVDQPRVVRTTDIIIGPPIDLCPPMPWVPSRRRRSAGRSGPVLGAVADLWPFSTITAGVLVQNHGNNGTLSDTISFTTPEGGTISSTLINILKHLTIENSALSYRRTRWKVIKILAYNRSWIVADLFAEILSHNSGCRKRHKPINNSTLLIYQMRTETVWSKINR